MKTLSDRDLELMRYIWDEEEAGNSGIPFAPLYSRMGVAKQTVNTLLTRMIDKGYLRTEGAPHKRRYFSTVSRAGYVALFAEWLAPGSKDAVEEAVERSNGRATESRG